MGIPDEDKELFKEAGPKAGAVKQVARMVTDSQKTVHSKASAGRKR